MYRSLLILCLLFIGFNQVSAENLLWWDRGQYFYRADVDISGLVIDESFSKEFQKTIETEVKKYYAITNVNIREVDRFTRVRNNLVVVNFNNDDFSFCNCGAYYSSGTIAYQDGNVRYSLVPLIVTPENVGVLVHELGHSLGLGHESPKSTYRLTKKKKKWVLNNQNKLLAVDQVMSYGARPYLHFDEMNFSDKVYFYHYVDKRYDFFTLTNDNLAEYNGADLLFMSNRQNIPAIENFNPSSYKDGYLTAIGYLETGTAEIRLPSFRDTYNVYIVPKSTKNNLPNPEDVSNLTKPLRIGKIDINKRNKIKLSKKLKKMGFKVKEAGQLQVKLFNNLNEIETEDIIVY